MALNLTIGPLAMFALVAAITPGPNNLLLMRSGARFGVRRSSAHMLGIQLGMIALLTLCHLGIGALLLAVPFVMTLLHWGCFAYLLWLTMVILRDAHTDNRKSAAQGTDTAHPMTLLQAMAFQFINPKAWVMGVTISSAFYGGAAPTLTDFLVTMLICLALGSSSMLVWTIWGAAIDHVLKRPLARQSFGYCMAAMVLATALWMLR